MGERLIFLPEALQFGNANGLVIRRFGLRMNTKRRQEFVDSFKPCASQGKPEEKIGIEREPVGRIDTSAFEIEILPPERRRLHQVGAAEEVSQPSEARLASLADGLAVSIHPVHVAEGDTNCRIAHNACDCLQRTRQIHIVRIEVRENISCSPGKAFG